MFQKNKEGNNKSGQQNDKDKGKRSFAGLGGPQQWGKDFHHHQQGKFKKGAQHDSRAPPQRKIQGACYNCNKIGHKAKDCRSAPAGGQQGRGQGQQQNRGHGQQQNHGQGQHQQGRGYGQQPQQRILFLGLRGQ
ncbi:annexin B11-like [Asparagus officinalis]|uniref:annexin B11-like n=1 Tax=Asparagus officinalis TaxID=4686 RepID=UPI00098E761A|nr:annexin B11-like [Asparagus officinalis]